MKKLFFSLVAAMMAATATYAQSSLLATLSHDGEISTYYGATALRDAYAAAADGDVITLSSGSFSAVNIEKGITIRGAGAITSGNTLPTIISGEFKISSSNNATLTLEGIYSNSTITCSGTVNKATFLKDRFKTINYNNFNYDHLTNLTMINCIVSNELNVGGDGSVACVNSFIQKPGYGSYEFTNCVVGAINHYPSSATFNNCIIGGSTYLESDYVAFKCVGVSGATINFFSRISNTTNIMKGYGDVFKTYTGTYNDDETFELTDEAKTTLIGLDGTQVGIYGGNMPYDPTPSNPQITKCNVAAKSTADGKLSVDITVNGAE